MSGIEMSGKPPEWLVEFFWKRVPEGAADDECWIWKGAYASGSARRAAVKSQRGGQTFCLYASRVAWWITTGSPPDSLILHTCDNGACVNPRHLYEGSQADNVRDAISRGRRAADANLRNAAWRIAMRKQRHLTDSEAREAKRRLARGEGVSSIARQLGVGYNLIYQIKRGVTYKDA